jgi:hypothetical protein
MPRTEQLHEIHLAEPAILVSVFECKPRKRHGAA